LRLHLDYTSSLRGSVLKRTYAPTFRSRRERTCMNVADGFQNRKKNKGKHCDSGVSG
jgi:hypothetical protein